MRPKLDLDNYNDLKTKSINVLRICTINQYIPKSPF